VIKNIKNVILKLFEIFINAKFFPFNVASASVVTSVRSTVATKGFVLVSNNAMMNKQKLVKGNLNSKKELDKNKSNERYVNKVIEKIIPENNIKSISLVEPKFL
jgi:membrane protein implicated in regulation of membrane protease activity